METDISKIMDPDESDCIPILCNILDSIKQLKNEYFSEFIILQEKNFLKTIRREMAENDARSSTCHRPVHRSPCPVRAVGDYATTEQKEVNLHDLEQDIIKFNHWACTSGSLIWGN